MCRDTASRTRRVCLNWETTTRQVCQRWRTDWTQRCDRWETQTQQQCQRWRTESEQRCDRWETEQTRTCASWDSWIRWLCIFWTWVTTTVCRAWSWVTTTVCEAWAWVTTTICRLWVWVGTLVCEGWVLLVTAVCRLWVLIVDSWCIIFCAFRRILAPTEFSEPRTECIYGWTSAYRIEDVRDCHLRITLRIRLVPDDDVTSTQLADCMNRWKTGIETAWTGQFVLMLTGGTCQCRRFTVEVDVAWVNSGEHHVVNVHAGSGRADMANFYVTDSGGVAAHEAGHMLGNPDEYADSNCPLRTVTSDGSIMQSSQTGTVKTRHYGGFARWISNRTCCTYEAR
jgi:hypothetical protein